VKYLRQLTLLSVSQVGTYVLPILILPHITRALGPEVFGQVIFAQATASYCQLVVDYGFIWTGPREIAGTKHCTSSLNKALSTILITQFLILTLSAISVFIITSFFSLPWQDNYLFAVALLKILFSTFCPLWLFQGLDELHTYYCLQFICGFISLAPVFTYVNDPSDAFVYLAIQCFAPFLTAIFTLIITFQKYSLRLSKVSLQEIIFSLRQSSTLFISRIFSSTYTYAVPVALGIFAGPSVLASYSLSDKVRNAAQSGLSSLNQFVYAKVLSSSDYKFNYKSSFFQAAAILQLLPALSCSAFLFLFATPIMAFLGGEAFASSTIILKFLSPTLLVVSVTSFLVVQWALPLRKDKLILLTTAIAALIALLFIPIACLYWGAEGAAAAQLFIELLILCILVYFLLSPVASRLLFLNFL
jgi:PST family polysaccharide transporter